MYVKKLSRKRYNSKKLRKSKRTTRRRRLIKKRGGYFCYNFTNNLHNMISICKEQVFIEWNLYEHVKTVANGDKLKSDILNRGWVEEEHERLQKLRFGLNTYKKLSISEKIDEIKKKLEDECFKKLEENERINIENRIQGVGELHFIYFNDNRLNPLKTQIRNILKDPVRKVELINQANEYSKKTQKKWKEMVNKLEKELKIEN